MWKGHSWLRTALEAERSLEPHLPLFNILYESYVATIIQINDSPPVLEEDCNVADLEHHLIDSCSTLHCLEKDSGTHSL